MPSVRTKPRVLVICISRAWGGLEQVAVDDAVALAKAKVPVHFLCLEDSPVFENLKALNSPEIFIERLKVKPRNILDLTLRRELRRILKGGVNIVHTHQTSLLGSIVPWMLPFPHVGLVATRHIMNKHNKRNVYHRALYSRIDSLLVMSEALKKNILETHSVAQGHVKTLHLGLDFSRFDPSKVDAFAKRKEWKVKEDELVVGLVGRIDPAKGQATYLQAAAKLRDEGYALKFVIVGEETKESQEGYLNTLKEMVRQYQLEDHVIFEGFTKDIPKVMASFDLFVMPSREEAFGLVAIEAMAMKIPVVISNRGSAKEIVGPAEEFGLLVRPDDAFDLRKALKTLIENPALRVKMGEGARKHVLGLFDGARRIQKTLEIYDRVLRRRSAVS